MYAIRSYYVLFRCLHIGRGLDVAFVAAEVVAIEINREGLDLQGFVAPLDGEVVIPALIVKDVDQHGRAEDEFHLTLRHAGFQHGHHFRGDEIALLDIGAVHQGEIFPVGTAGKGDEKGQEYGDENLFHYEYNLWPTPHITSFAQLV